MRNWLVFLVVVGCAAGTMSTQTGLIVDRPEFDFGVMPPGSTVRHRIGVIAVGQDTLEVREIKTGCGCIVVSPENAVVPPGDTAFIDILWTLQDTAGTFSQSSYLFSSAGQDPYLIVMKATCRSDRGQNDESISVSPVRIVSTIADTAGSRQFLTIRNFSDRNFAAEVVSSPFEGMDIRIPDSLPAGATEKAEILISPGAFPDKWRGSITIELSDDQGAGKRLTIPVLIGNSRTQ